jgi:hypothetical protein
LEDWTKRINFRFDGRRNRKVIALKKKGGSKSPERDDEILKAYTSAEYQHYVNYMPNIKE